MPWKTSSRVLLLATYLVLLGALSVLLVSCGGGGGGDDSDPILPIANAGTDQRVNIDSTVTLDGSGSSDADGNLLTYSWTFTSMPTGSSATLSDTAAMNPQFTADLDGLYVLNLMVNNGAVNSIVDTVTINATLFAYVQWRTYEGSLTSRTSGWLDLAENMYIDDVVSISLLNSSDVAIAETSDFSSFPGGTDYLSYNCLAGTCTSTLKTLLAGELVGLTDISAGTYTYILETSQGRILEKEVTYQGEISLPLIPSSTIISSWNENGDLTIVWENPTGEENWSLVNQIRLNLSNADVDGDITIKLSPRYGNSITIPAVELAKIFSEIQLDSLTVAVTTRAYDAEGSNYARGYSSRVGIVPKSGGLANRIEIVSVSPNVITAGVNTDITVVVSYETNYSPAEIALAFNVTEPNGYMHFDSILVDSSSGTVTLTAINVDPVAWSSVEFSALVILSDYSGEGTLLTLRHGLIPATGSM